MGGSISTEFLLVLARIRPQIWEIIGGGPYGWRTGAGPGARAEHPGRYAGSRHTAGPQPDPWSVGRQISAVRLTRRIADAAAAEQTRGNDGPGFLAAAVSDWCGNEDLKFPFPPKWPVPGDDGDHPRPDEAADASAVFAAGAVSFAALAGGVREPALRQGLLEASSKMADQAVSLLPRT